MNSFLPHVTLGHNVYHSSGKQTRISIKGGCQGRDSRRELEVGTVEECCLHACFQDQLAMEVSTPLLSTPNQEARQCWLMFYDHAYTANHSWVKVCFLEVKVTGMCHS